MRFILSSSILLLGGAAALPARGAERVVAAPAARLTEPARGPSETAIFAGGCFWGVQAVFAHVEGVTSTIAGYAGGSAATARYDVVASGATRHAEAVQVTFDPRRVNYADLLRVYFSVVADPTRLNAQGPDHGPQYRSALFPQNAAQAAVARAYIAQLGAARLWDRPIVTRLERLPAFYPAEAYHQQFLAKHPDHPYIVVNDQPKVAALRRLYPRLWRA